MPHQKPDSSTRIFLSPPFLNGHEIERIEEAIASNYIAPLGPQVDAFEKALAETADRRFAVAVSSGTAAMHLALRVLGIGEGDLVVASSLTFIGSVTPIVFLGAVPVFIDADPATWNMDANLLEDAIADLAANEKRPAAVIPTDLYGQCADYAALEGVCARYGIPLIIDAAESLGASCGRRPAGCSGRAAIFSFNGNKIITTSGGGALLTDDRRMADYARKLSQQAREPLPHYEHIEIGYNYRMSNILAAVGLGQLHDLAWRVSRKREIFRTYEALFHDTPGISFMPEAAYGRSSRWLSVCLIDAEAFGADRETIRQTLENENIESRPVWKPMHLQPVFKEARVMGGAVSERLFEHGLCLPSGLNLTFEDQSRITDIVKNCRA